MTITGESGALSYNKSFKLSSYTVLIYTLMFLSHESSSVTPPLSLSRYKARYSDRRE